MLMERNKLISLEDMEGGPVRRTMLSLLGKPLEYLLGIHHVNNLYDRIRDLTDIDDFLDAMLEDMDVCYAIRDDDLARIPKEGPAIIVANHPYGGIEGVILADLLRSVRKDTMILANYLLGHIPPLRQTMIMVDPFETDDAARSNIRPLKESLGHLRNGGLLGAFPSGTVSHLHLSKRTVTDPEWSPTIARLARKTKAPILPVYFEGRNGPLFQLLGLVHPRLRTAMLVRELFNKRGSTIRVSIGQPIPFRKISGLETDEDIMDYIRLRTYMLKTRTTGAKRRRLPIFGKKQETQTTDMRALPPVPPGYTAEELRNEVDTLPDKQHLVKSGDFDVYFAAHAQIPRLIDEIGRLREVTFRAVGEGTGGARDLDAFDEYYAHLFVWNRAKSEVVGAYRIGRSDEIIAKYDVDGLYTNTLFKFKRDLFDLVGPSLEMGRSFVREEYQKAYTSLLLLWKGIAAYVALHPTYKTLFGPVSISSDYSHASREIMIRHLREYKHLNKSVTRMVKPKMPPKLNSLKLKKHELEQFRGMCSSIDDITDFIADIEVELKGIPVLLKQYLRLGGKILAFNVDPDFNDAIDGLLVVDMTVTDPKVLAHYMGKENAREFLEFHRQQGTLGSTLDGYHEPESE